MIGRTAPLGGGELQHEAAGLHYPDRRSCSVVRGKGEVGSGAAGCDAGYRFLHPGASEIGARDVAAFRKGLQETGYIEGQNVTTEYHWLEGQYGRLPAVNSDLTRRSVAVIAIPGSVVAARAAKAAMATTQSCSNA